MTEKLEITEKRFDEINEKLTDINVINDQEQYKSLMKELKNRHPDNRKVQNVQDRPERF